MPVGQSLSKCDLLFRRFSDLRQVLESEIYRSSSASVFFICTLMKAFKLICFPQQKVYLSIHRFFNISQWILILRRKWFYHLLQKSSLLLNTSVVPQEQKNFSYNLSRSIVSLDFKQENVLFFHSKSSELSTGIIYSYPQSPDTVT